MSRRQWEKMIIEGDFSLLSDLRNQERAGLGWTLG